MFVALSGCSSVGGDNPDNPVRREPLAADLGQGVTIDFVWIPAGRFATGGGQSGLARQSVTINRGFYLGKYEVTQEQWMAVLDSNPSLNKGAKLPVERVNWDELQKFLARLNRKFAAKKLKFMLPTEAQWEYACRAGASSRGDTTDHLDLVERYAWIGGNSNYESHPVGKKRPNEWGLYDMQGNVAEWCGDLLDVKGRPVAKAGGEAFYAVRGGNWRGGESQCTSTAREIRRASVSLRFDGLRLACRMSD